MKRLVTAVVVEELAVDAVSPPHTQRLRLVEKTDLPTLTANADIRLPGGSTSTKGSWA